MSNLLPLRLFYFDSWSKLLGLANSNAFGIVVVIDPNKLIYLRRGITKRLQGKTNSVETILSEIRDICMKIGTESHSYGLEAKRI